MPKKLGIRQGGVLGQANQPNPLRARGLWRVSEVFQARSEGTWRNQFPDIGDPLVGGFFAGIIDTTQSGSVLTEDTYQQPVRYALVVSPKGLESSQQWQSPGGEADDAKTLWNGLAAQEALVGPDGDSTYPAFDYAQGLTDFGGFSPTRDGYDVFEPGDLSRWYLPALDELYAAYWNLKPRDADNSTADSEDSLFFDFPDDQFPSGRSLSSDPQRTAFTSTIPAQTGVSRFQDGEPQQLAATTHWSASFASDVNQTAWSPTVFNGGIFDFPQTSSQVVRPFRRLILPT